eukprot:3690418-Amphidinium_carterae.1
MNSSDGHDFYRFLDYFADMYCRDYCGAFGTALLGSVLGWKFRLPSLVTLLVATAGEESNIFKALVLLEFEVALHHRFKERNEG